MADTPETEQPVRNPEGESSPAVAEAAPVVTQSAGG